MDINPGLYVAISLIYTDKFEVNKIFSGFKSPWNISISYNSFTAYNICKDIHNF